MYLCLAPSSFPSFFLSSFYIKKNLLFFYYFFGGCAQSSFAVCRFCLVTVSGATLSCGAEASHCGGFSCCGTLFQAHRRQLLWLTVSRAGLSGCGTWTLVGPQHVESSWIGHQTHVSCISRWVLIHCTTREVPSFCI